MSSELVTNLNNDEEFEVTVSFTSSTVSLGPGSLQTIPVIVTLPGNTPANTEIEIMIIMKSQGNLSVQDSEIVSLSAKQDHRWEINGEYLGNSIRNSTIITAPGETGQVTLEAINIGNLEDGISLETSISIIYSGSDNSQGWDASGTSIEGIQVNQTGNPSVSWSVPNNAWNGTIMQIRVDASARGDVVDTIIFNVEVPHIKEWRAISSQVDLEINPEGSSIDIEILQLGNSPSNAYSTVYVNGSNDWIVETPEELPILSPGESAFMTCLLYTSPSPRDATLSRMPSSA